MEHDTRPDCSSFSIIVKKMDNRDKIKQGLKDAAACARGECDCPESTYTVRNRPGRVAVTNQTTGKTTIYPMPK